MPGLTLGSKINHATAANLPANLMDASPLIPAVADPVALFRAWFAEAVASEPDVPDAMSLATATPDGKPSVRMVLMKGISEKGLLFYSNAESRKGAEIAANPKAAVCFHWKTLRRQVRIEGTLAPATIAQADDYWNTRPRQSQIASFASEQSRPLESRAALQARVADATARFAGQPIPRAPEWVGYCLSLELIEFWHDVRDRLHDRLVFHKTPGGWRTERLYP